MNESVDVKLFFNFRSPYCYLASKRLWSIFDDYHTNLIWRPFGGWDGRSAPERAKIKIPLTRQDVARWARRMGVPLNPPPLTTDPTHAGLVSLLAQEQDVLRDYIVEMMRAEWSYGLDIGEEQVILDVGEKVGLGKNDMLNALQSEAYKNTLAANKAEADSLGVFGVPTFVIGEAIFWGNDRIDFVHEHLDELRARRI